MTPARDHSPLSVLGFSVADEEVYHVLLRSSPMTYDELATLSGVGAEAVREAVARFRAAGLAQLRGDALVAAPPEQAFNRLIGEESGRLRTMQEQLDALEGLLPTLAAEHTAMLTPQGHPINVELVEGGDVVALIRSLTSGAPGDVMWLRPDQWRIREGDAIDDWVRELLAEGRRSRAIYPARVLEEAPDVVRARVGLGEHVRVLAEVPGRMGLVRNAVALIPETFGVADEHRLIVRQPSIIRSLTMLFESLWDRALAVPGLGSLADDTEEVSARRLLVDQLARGMKDDQIARTLGMSVRTVRRRVAAVMDELEVESRFQAGVEAVRRGWL